MFLTDTDSPEKLETKIPYGKGLMEHSQIVSECSQYQVPPILKISRKSNPFFRNVASSETDRKTDRPTDERENITFAGRGDEKQMHISDLTEHISQEVY